MRHTNFIDSFITTHGQMLQLGTLCSSSLLFISLSLVADSNSFVIADDNAGANASWINPSTAKAIVSAYPRREWTGCFGGKMRKEVELKPWRLVDLCFV